MTTPRRPLIAGNWKMNGLAASAAELTAMAAGAAGLHAVDLLVCPPATLVMRFAALGGIAIGGQDCHAEPNGAFTGDIAAEMLADAGARAVILGHSERRALHRETDAQVRGKVEAAWRAGLLAIVCVGETKAERLDGRTLDGGRHPAVGFDSRRRDGGQPRRRLRTGVGDRNRTDADDGRCGCGARVHPRGVWRGGSPMPPPGIRILYGGSVKPANAAELLGVDNVDGALVGGASLKAEEFLAIAGVYAP